MAPIIVASYIHFASAQANATFLPVGSLWFYIPELTTFPVTVEEKLSPPKKDKSLDILNPLTFYPTAGLVYVALNL